MIMAIDVANGVFLSFYNGKPNENDVTLTVGGNLTRGFLPLEGFCFSTYVDKYLAQT